MAPPAPDSDDTSGLEEARKALAESRTRSRNDRQVTERVSHQLNQVRQIREVNHFAESFINTLRGNG